MLLRAAEDWVVRHAGPGEIGTGRGRGWTWGDNKHLKVLVRGYKLCTSYKFVFKTAKALHSMTLAIITHIIS